MQKYITSLLYLTGIVLFILSPSFAGDTNAISADEPPKGNLNRLNLSGTPLSNRFTITDRIWSSNYGEASVCLWKDDKLAAISVSIDDNIPQEHNWWINIGSKYNWSFTWFIIVHYIEENASGFGTWSDFKKLQALGHDMQSHSYDHNHYDDQRSDSLVSLSYTKSIKSIESNIPGAKVLTLAYPNGHGKEELSSKHFIAARGVVGRPNNAAKTNYTWTYSGTFTNEWIDNLIVKNPSESQYWRGWSALCFHDVAKGNTPQEQQASLDNASLLFDYVHTKENDIWVENYTNIAKYGQERDSHTLKVLKTDSSLIQLFLADSLTDTIFSYPLTIKVPVSGSWTDKCVAYQNKSKIPSSFIKFRNGYVLIQATPDRGNIFLFKDSSDPTIPEKTGSNVTTNITKKKVVNISSKSKVNTNVIDIMGRRVQSNKRKQPRSHYTIIKNKTNPILK
jgi:hypothetical protein